MMSWPMPSCARRTCGQLQRVGGAKSKNHFRKPHGSRDMEPMGERTALMRLTTPTKDAIAAAVAECKMAIESLGAAWASLLAAYESARTEVKGTHRVDQNINHLNHLVGADRLREILWGSMIHNGLGYLIEKNSEQTGRRPKEYRRRNIATRSRIRPQRRSKF
jgi:hypothetical protein